MEVNVSNRGGSDINVPNIQYRFGHDTLGPVVTQYLSRLQAYLSGFSENNDAKVLFVSRAGIRIRKALQEFCGASGRAMPIAFDDFWVSRLMIAKGVWRRSRGDAIDLIQGEFSHSPLRELVISMFRNEGIPDAFDMADKELDQYGSTFREFMNSGSRNALLLSAYFDEQSDLFEAYLKDIVSGHSQICLVDSGWQGTIQRLLQKSFPDLDWWGTYFGKYGVESTDRTYWRKMVGLAFEQDHFDPKKPQTSIIHHRHLIEDLFEPAGKSVERLVAARNGRIVAPESRAILEEVVSKETDPIFAGVMDYLGAVDRRYGVAEIDKRATKAWNDLARFITTPTREEAIVFSGMTRSADFGKQLKVGVLLEPKDRRDGDSPESRIEDSLWPTAQIALEYPAEMAEQLQRKVTGLGKAVFGRTDLAASGRSQRKSRRAKVAVITRTMDRPMFLRRAILSVARQTFTDYLHVIVNDGGDVSSARQTILSQNCDHSKIILVDNVDNRGMEAASNIAISAVDSDYIVIHDDDDTWEPDFLLETVDFLEDPRNTAYGGVITKTTYVSEEVTPKGLKVHGTAPYQDWVENVHLMEMAIGNFFAPIAFLFSRDVYDKIGGFDERYPVLGDWDFNLRFLLESDIGVLPKTLANYHHRDVGDTSLFGNSVISGRDKHLEYAAIVRNKFARNLLHADHPAVAMLVGMGLHFGANRDSLNAVNHKLDHLSGVVTRSAESGISASRPQSADSEVQNRSGLPEEYWVALTNLKTAIELNDREVLDKLNGGKVRRLQVLTRKRMGPLSEELMTDRQIKELASLKGKQYSRVIPPPDFDEVRYLSLYPDVAEGVASGQFMNGYEHYYFFGRYEQRARPSVS